MHAPSRVEWSFRPALTALAAALALVWTSAAGSDSRLPENREGGGPRTAVMSAFEPELAVLLEDLEHEESVRINGIEFVSGGLYGKPAVLFLSGVSIVNAAMAAQTALDHFDIERIIFSGIAGGVDPELNIGDVIIADRWGQYLEMVFARDAGEGWAPVPFFEYPFGNFGMMHPRPLTVMRSGSSDAESRFWFPVDEQALEIVRSFAPDVKLDDCVSSGFCLSRKPKVVVGGPGVSGSAFVDNKAFREYTHKTFGARVLDMESAAVAHVAYVNAVPFLAVRSLSDLAGGEPGESEFETFIGLAAGNARIVLERLLRDLPETRK